MSITTALTYDAVVRRLERLKRLQGAMREEIHALAVQALVYCGLHGDARIAARLLDAVPQGTARTLSEWFRHYGAGLLVLSRNARGWQGKMGPYRAHWEERVEGAAKAPYYDMGKEQPEPKSADLAAIEAFLGRLARGGEHKDGTPKTTPRAQSAACDLLVALRQWSEANQ